MVHRAFVSLTAVSLLALSGCAPANPDPLPDLEAATALRDGAGGGGGVEVEQATGTGWATLKGKFVYAGGTVDLAPLPTGGKDPEACGVMPIPDQSLVVGDSGGLKNVVVFARRVSRVHDSAEEMREEPVRYDQHYCVFTDHVMGVLVGQPLQLTNSDPVGHNVKIAPTNGVGMNNTIQGGGETTFAFSGRENSPVQVRCSIHPWMLAYVLPRNDPYFAVTAEDGSFEIANLPDGEEIQFQVWHERTPGGLEVNGWSRGRFTQTLEEDEVLDLGTIEVSPDAVQ